MRVVRINPIPACCIAMLLIPSLKEPRLKSLFIGFCDQKATATFATISIFNTTINRERTITACEAYWGNTAITSNNYNYNKINSFRYENRITTI